MKGSIPPAALESLSVSPTSQQMREAAAELEFRLDHGEFDDLDEMQRSDLDMLAKMIALWACRVADLEAAMQPPAAEERDDRPKP